MRDAHELKYKLKRIAKEQRKMERKHNAQIVKESRETMFRLGDQMIPIVTIANTEDILAAHDLDEYCIKPLSMKNGTGDFVKLCLPIN